MAFSMKERNDKKAFADYEKAARTLMDETVRRRKEIYEKYKSTELTGLDGAPWDQEYKKITEWFSEELRQLRNRFGIR